MADKRIDQLVAASTIGNNDLFVLEQNNQAKKLSGSTLASFVYNAAADKIDEVNQAVADAQNAVDSLEEQKDTIAQSIADMAQYGTDTTLTTPGIAADAEATGDRIKVIEADALAGLDQAKISGVAVASFDDGADNVPIKALRVGIEPVQDLHGYDYPWPAGGGKNKLDTPTITQTNITFTQASDGYITASPNNSDPRPWEYSYAQYKFTLPAGSYKLVWQVKTAATVVYAGYRLFTDSDETLSERDGTQGFNSGGATSEIVLTESTNLGLQVKLYDGAARFMIVAYSDTNTWAPYSNICPITGFTETTVRRTGKNLLPSSITTTLASGITYTRNDDGTITVRGTSTGYSMCYCDLKTLKPGTYISSGMSEIGRNATAYVRMNVMTEANSALAYDYGSGVTFTLTKPTTIRFRIDISSGLTVNGKVYPMVRLASVSDSTYEPYTANEYEVEFPVAAGTVYGGTVDVTNGKLTVDRCWIDAATLISHYEGYNSSNNNYVAYMTNAFMSTIGVSSTKNSAQAVCNLLSTNYSWNEMQDFHNSNACGVFRNLSWNYTRVYISLNDPSITSKENFETWLTSNNFQLTYKLDTPIVYDLTPTEIKTLIAINNIFADTGNIVNLIYRRKPVSDADIQEQIDAIRDAIADREDTGVASKNYAAGSLVLIGSSLVETSTSIVTGESIVIGTNCQETTVAAQIAYLKSIVDSLGNLAYLSYETA